MTDNTVIDLSPLLQALVSIATIALTTLGSWALTRLSQKLGIEKNVALLTNLTVIANNAISFAVMKTQDQIKEKGWDHISVQNQLVAEGARFVTEKFSDTLKLAGVDAKTPEGQKSIHDLVLRALPGGVTAVADSPTTPSEDSPVVAVVAVRDTD